LSDSSYITKSFFNHIFNSSGKYLDNISFSINIQIEWNVQIRGKLPLEYTFLGGSTHKVLPTLSLISLAALLVKVTINISFGLIFFSLIIYSTLAVRVAVFQLPAQAIISNGHSILFFASSCFGFKFIYFY